MISETEVKLFPYSNEEINEYYEVFSFYDRHNTGSINLNELGLIIRSIGFNPSELLIKQFRDEYEQIGIDKINFQQLLQILVYFTNEIEDEIDIIEAFRVFDKEGQGMIILMIKSSLSFTMMKQNIYPLRI